MANKNDGGNLNQPMNWSKLEVAPENCPLTNFAKPHFHSTVTPRQVHLPSTGVCWDMSRLGISLMMPKCGLIG